MSIPWEKRGACGGGRRKPRQRLGSYELDSVSAAGRRYALAEVRLLHEAVREHGRLDVRLGHRDDRDDRARGLADTRDERLHAGVVDLVVQPEVDDVRGRGSQLAQRL